MFGVRSIPNTEQRCEPNIIPVVLIESQVPVPPAFAGPSASSKHHYADGATNVQHHRRRYLAQTALETTVPRSTKPASASTNGHSPRDMSADWRCTFVARGADDAAGYRRIGRKQNTETREIAGPSASVPRPKMASDDYT